MHTILCSTLSAHLFVAPCSVVGLDTEVITPFFTKGRPTLALVSLSSHTHCYLVDCPELSRSTTPDQLLKTFA